MRRGEWNLHSDELLLENPEFGRPKGPLQRIPHLQRLSVRNQWIALGSGASLLVFILILIVTSATHSKSSNGNYSNVIFFIGDGFGPASEVLARTVYTVEKHPEFNSPDSKTFPLESLALDEYLLGTARSYSTSSYVTDSAAGATAYSCVQKTFNYGIAVDDQKNACGTVMEAAKTKGMAVGIVATSRVTHATPASYISHSVDRNWEEFIAQQEVEFKPDVLFGGGAAKFNTRCDKRDLFEEAKANGYTVIRNYNDFEKLTATPALGIFADSHMSYEVDRDPTQQPSLAQMTSKAIELLTKTNKKGFFLMVEGSRIDHAGHSNDAVAHYRDILAFQEAWKVAVEFAKNNGKTTLVSVADHETGGLTLGANSNYFWKPEMVAKGKCSAEIMDSKLRKLGGDYSQISTLVQDCFQITLTQQEVDDLKGAYDRKAGVYDTIRLISSYFAKRADIGWTTDAHTGVDINVYGYGPDSEKLRGNMENVEVGKVVSSLLNLNLEAESKRIKSFNPTPQTDDFPSCKSPSSHRRNPLENPHH
eukprot:TRINITY_DN1389_c0_g1_i2.p1 TRINITY_DN1389_c0_g1~~TRINITY_DN1389_c0_g1_i2.p1  ORF type:complete len:534 (-),score=158.00 TRINITY_DN1389_c0_g1_i2:72-1673(-)